VLYQIVRSILTTVMLFFDAPVAKCNASEWREFSSTDYSKREREKKKIVLRRLTHTKSEAEGVYGCNYGGVSLKTSGLDCEREPTATKRTGDAYRRERVDTWKANRS
jgi:hypothetical protein